MNTRLASSAIVGAGVGYLVIVAWAMGNLAWDIWGALIIVPPMTVITVLAVRRMFDGDLQPLAIPILGGFAVKIAGSAVRYWVAFDAYGGATDAQRYHRYASRAAAAVWRGDASFRTVLPGARGTEFVERFTSFVYTLMGSSKLGGFVFFGWLSFWGMALFVKAACIAIPGLAQRRYAYLCAFAPSLVYWPSSIGKEALLMLFLGMATYGIARVVSRHGFFRPLLIAAAGLTGVAFVRPHIAGVWLVGVAPALLVALGRTFSRSNSKKGRGVDSFALLVVAVIAGAALISVGSFALKYLQPTADDTQSVSGGITSILDETARRSSQGGSNFSPTVVSSPADWPIAVARTLTRPLLIEARSVFQLISALEMTALIGIGLLAWPRIVALPRSILSIPFVAFAMSTLFAAGLAYSSFANLGLLTRQKSLVIPLMVLLPCLPLRRPADVVRADDVDERPRLEGVLASVR